MEENKSSVAKYALPLAAVIIIVIAVAASYMSSNDESVENTNTRPFGGQTSEEARNPDTAQAESQYMDGTYTAMGSYVSPGGLREVEVSITLASDVVVDTTFEGGADDPTSERFQGEFGENYVSMITGKNINEVELTKVSGSSLTPKGFMDALEKIKTQAQS